MSRSASPSLSDRAVEDQLGYGFSPYSSYTSDHDSEFDIGANKEDPAETFHAAQEEQPSPPDPQSANAARDADDDATSQAICRICLDGPQSESEGGESLGRLLSPCRCKGTMKYVHATCLDRWRSMSARTSSIIACDQCGAPYRFRKSKYVGIATSPALLFALSFFLFLLLIWTVGLFATFWMDVYDSDSVNQDQPKQSSSWWPWRGARSVYDDPWLEDDVGLSYSNYWSYGGLVYEPFAYVKLIKEAVRQFTSGEAAEAVKEAVGLNDADNALAVPAVEQPEQGFWSSLKHEWMYGDGGLWAGQSSGEASVSSIAADVASPIATPVKERYDARRASPYDAAARAKPSKTRIRRTAAALRSSASRPSWLNKILLQFSLGFSLVGIISFVNLLLGASFLGPFNLHNFGLGRSFARMTSRRSSGRNGSGQDGVNVASILIVILVVIGVLRALHLVYKGVRSLARRFLSRLEEAIVDWQGEDEPQSSQFANTGPYQPDNLEI